MPGSGNKDHIEIALDDCPIQMDVHEIEAGRRAPVAQQPLLDVVGRKPLSKQRVFEKVDLSQSQVVGCAPIGIDQLSFRVRQYRHKRSSPLRALSGGLGRYCYDAIEFLRLVASVESI